MVLQLQNPLLNKSHHQYAQDNDNYGTHYKITGFHHLYNFYKENYLNGITNNN
jgi:hypothetical protein